MDGIHGITLSTVFQFSKQSLSILDINWKFGVSLEVTESRFRSIHLQNQALHSSNKIFIKISYWIYTHTPSSQSYSYNQDTIYYKWATMGQCEDDIKIPFPLVHSILIRRECISCIFWLVERQIRDKKLQLKCGWCVKTTSWITPYNLYSRVCLKKEK